MECGAGRNTASRVGPVGRGGGRSRSAPRRIRDAERGAHLQPVHLFPILMTRLHPLWERVVIVAFVATIAVPGLATLAAIDRPTSRNENRELAAFPPVPTDLPSLRAFPDAFTRYF